MPLIVLGSDHAGFALKEAIKKHLELRGLSVADVGPACAESCDYPVFARKVARLVQQDKATGILICGTGMGMAMAANRFRGVRAALCSHEFHARMTRQHNDANILCLGERVVGQGLALAIVDAFIDTPFEGGRHQRRVEMIDQIEDTVPEAATA